MPNKEFSEKSEKKTSKPCFDFVFGGFKQREPSNSIIKGEYKRKYRSEVGKL